MGESREGEGSGREATTTVIARYVIQELRKDGYEVERITVEFVTKGLYAVDVLQRGSNEPERYFLGLED